MSRFERFSLVLIRAGLPALLLAGGVLVGEAVGGAATYFSFEDYRNNNDPAPSLIPYDGYSIVPAENWPNYPNPAGSTSNELTLEFINSVSGNNVRLFSHNQAVVGSFSSDVPWSTVPQDGRENNFSWNISQDIDTTIYPGADPAAPRDLYDVHQGGDNELRPGMSGTSQYTFEVSFKQSIQRGFQALIGRDYIFQDSLDHAPAGSDRDGSPWGAFFLGLAANDGPGESQETRIHFHTYDTNGTRTSTLAEHTGNPYHGVGPVIQADVWYDLAAIGDGEDVTLYLKESSEANFNAIATLPQSGLNYSNDHAGWSFGRGWYDFTDDGIVNGGPAHGFRGWMDEIRIIDNARSVGELLAVAPVEPLAADFNQDGIVDGHDLLVWQRGLGLTDQTDNSNGDADGNGVVDGLDLEVWEGQFGSTESLSINTAVVPEPTGVALAFVGFLMLSMAGRGRLRA